MKRTDEPRRPRGRPAMRMTWRSLLFAHWPVRAEELQPLVPDGLAVDTFDDDAWVGLIPFTMRDVRATWVPPVPGTHRFHECNVRTYVRGASGPGVFFFSLDAASPLAAWIARKLWRLNYFAARIELERSGDEVRYEVERRRRGVPSSAWPRMRCRWRIGEPLPPAQPGELAYFLTERYMLYTVNRRGMPRCGRIWHRPWSLRHAELLELDDGLVAAAGIEVSGPPATLQAAEPLSVEAWLPEN